MKRGANKMEKIRVSISNKQHSVKIPSGIRLLIRRCCNAVLQEEHFEKSAEISVSFVNNTEIKRLNSFYRNKDIETDVLSFPLGENGKYDVNPETGACCLGDIAYFYGNGSQAGGNLWAFPAAGTRFSDGPFHASSFGLRP